MVAAIDESDADQGRYTRGHADPPLRVGGGRQSGDRPPDHDRGGGVPGWPGATVNRSSPARSRQTDGILEAHDCAREDCGGDECEEYGPP